MCVAVGRFYLYHIATHFKHRDVERAAAEVEDRYFFVFLFIKSVGERRGRRLVDDAQYLKTGNLPRGLGRTALVVVKVGGHGNHRLSNLLAKLRLGVGFHLAQYHRRNFFGAIPLFCHLDLDTTGITFTHFKGDDGLILLHFRLVI